jgi:opacity protein-like surface antigen
MLRCLYSIAFAGVHLALVAGACAADIDLKSLQPLETKKKKNGSAYVGVFAGTTISQRADMKLEFTGHSLRYDVDNEQGNFFTGLEVGYSWRTPYYVEVGLEFEGFFGGTEVNSIVSNSGNDGVPINLSDTATAQADLNYVAFMLNGTLTLDLRRMRHQVGNFVPRFRPYVGGGIGGAQVFYREQRTQTFGDLFAAPTPAAVNPFSIDEFVFAWQLFAGLEFRINEKLAVYGEYRRFYLAKTNDLQRLETDMMLGGMRFRY